MFLLGCWMKKNWLDSHRDDRNARKIFVLRLPCKKNNLEDGTVTLPNTVFQK